MKQEDSQNLKEFCDKIKNLYTLNKIDEAIAEIESSTLINTFEINFIKAKCYDKKGQFNLAVQYYLFA